MIEIRFDDARFYQQVQNLIHGIQDASPLMRIVAGDMKDEVKENFKQQGRPKWLGFKFPPSKKRGGASAILLQDSGQLFKSIQSRSDAKSAVVGTNKKYAAVHQFGHKFKPYVILPKNKKALAFGGRVVKKVNHPGSDIPARPFLMLTPSGEDKILSHTNRYLQNLLD